MSRNRLHHVGVIVPSDERLQRVLEVLGLDVHHRQYVDRYQADCHFVDSPGGTVEFIVPREGKLKEFNRGFGGLHHLAIEVDDLEQATADLASRDIDLLETEPVDAGSIRINFMDPVYTGGIIVEFVQSTAPDGDRP